MKKFFQFIIVCLMTTLMTSCVYDELLAERPEQEYETNIPVEPPYVPTDTMVITIHHTSDTLPSPKIYGEHASMVDSTTTDGSTVHTTVGAVDFMLTDLIDIDSIAVVIIN